MWSTSTSLLRTIYIKLQLVSTIHNYNKNIQYIIEIKEQQKDMCVATRVATGFRAGCHHAKGKCGIKQKTKIKKTLNITLHLIQSLIILAAFDINTRVVLFH